MGVESGVESGACNCLQLGRECRILRTAYMHQRDEDLNAIRQLAADWRAGWLAGDAETLLCLFSDEPVLMPQDQPAVRGKEAIRALYEAVLKDYAIRSEDQLMEVESSGDLGYFWSTYALLATPKVGGGPVKSSGKSLFIVRRTPDGRWKIARVIDNSNGVTADQPL